MRKLTLLITLTLSFTLNAFEGSSAYHRSLIKRGQSFQKNISPILKLNAEAPENFTSPKVVSFEEIFLSFHKVLDGEMITKVSDDSENYYLLFSPIGRHHLLRQKLLSELGFEVASMKAASELTLNFASKDERKTFLSKLEFKTTKDAENWVVNEEKKSVTLQDVIIFKESPDSLKVSRVLKTLTQTEVDTTPELHQLLLPYAITDIPENLNGWEWTIGREEGETLEIRTGSETPLIQSEDQLTEMAKVLARLNRETISTLVSETGYPEAVAMLMEEKLLSRINSLHEILPSVTTGFSIDPLISTSDELVDGQLTKEQWEGFSGFYSTNDESSSPLSRANLFNFLTTNVFSDVLSYAVKQFNSIVLPQISLNDTFIDQQIENVLDDLVDFATDGENDENGFGFYSTPTAGGKLTLSRSISTGTSGSSDGVVSLYDSIGFTVSLGATIGIENTPLPFTLSGSGSAYIKRTYPHSRTITNLKEAIKEPFKNVLVFLTKNELGNLLGTLENPEKLEETPEYQQRLLEVWDRFNESFPVGESIIIKDSLGDSFKLSGSYPLTEAVKLQNSVSKKNVLLSRIYITRKGENRIQVVKSVGDLGTYGVSLGLKSGITIMDISYDKSKGDSKVKFVNVDVNPAETPLESATALYYLKDAFLHLDMDRVASLYGAEYVRNNYEVKDFDFDFLFFGYSKHSNEFRLELEDKNKEFSHYYRRELKKKTDFNYQDLAEDLVNDYISENTDINYSLNLNMSGIGSSIFAKSTTTKFIYEGKLNSAQNQVEQPFASVTIKSKDWKLTKRKFKNLIADIKHKYGVELYDSDSISKTKRLRIYKFYTYYYLYTAAFDRLMNITNDELTSIIKGHINYEEYPQLEDSLRNRNGDPEQKVRSYISQAKSYLKKYKKYHNSGNLEKSSKYVIKFIGLTEKLLLNSGFTQIMGGASNYDYRLKVSGYRETKNEDDSDSISLKFYSNKDYDTGLLEGLRSELGLSSTLFNSYWITGS